MVTILKIGNQRLFLLQVICYDSVQLWEKTNCSHHQNPQIDYKVIYVLFAGI